MDEKWENVAEFRSHRNDLSTGWSRVAQKHNRQTGL